MGIIIFVTIVLLVTAGIILLRGGKKPSISSTAAHQCSKCRHINPHDGEFCGSCGAKLHSH